MYVCHDFIDLLCYTLFYLFSQQKQVHVTIIHIKSTIKKQKNNFSFSKHQCLKFVCLILPKKKTLKHLQFRKKEWHIF